MFGEGVSFDDWFQQTQQTVHRQQYKPSVWRIHDVDVRSMPILGVLLEENTWWDANSEIRTYR